MKMSMADMMLIFDVIMAVLGVYLLTAAVKMKRTKRVPTLLVPEQELKRCRHPEDFAAFMAPKTRTFSIVILIFAAQGLVNGLLKTGRVGTVCNVVMLIVFIANWGWFSSKLQKGKEKYCGSF